MDSPVTIVVELARGMFPDEAPAGPPPPTDLAPLLVAAQMLINLLLLGTVVRLLPGAAQTGLQRKEESPVDAEERSGRPDPADRVGY